MNFTLPFFENYTKAFAYTSAAGFIGIGVDVAASAIKNNTKMKEVTIIHELGIKAILLVIQYIKDSFQTEAGVRMYQAGMLCLGYTTIGQFNHTLMVFAVSPGIGILTFIADKLPTPMPIREGLNFVNHHMGAATMTAALISSIVIAGKIGFFDLLPLAIVSSASYLGYKAYIRLHTDNHTPKM